MEWRLSRLGRLKYSAVYPFVLQEFYSLIELKWPFISVGYTWCRFGFWQELRCFAQRLIENADSMDISLLSRHR